MERFNLSFRRRGMFYMEGDISVDLDVDGPAKLADVIAKAETKEFAKFYPTHLEFLDDEWKFGRAGPATPPPHVVNDTEEPLDAA